MTPSLRPNGLELFAKAHEQLTTLDVPIPQLLLLDHAGGRMAADVALVHDVPGTSLEDLLASDAATAVPVLERLREALRRMESASHPTYGKVGARAGTAPDFPEAVLHRAVRHVDSAAIREPRIAAAAEQLRDALRTLAAQVRPRTRYSLVHGELGPDHVRVDAAGLPVLIDIEGLMWADVEWEHAFLELRFGDHYGHLQAPNLDDARLQLYRLASHISLVEGPLRLLESSFPDAQGMRAIAEYNLAQLSLSSADNAYRRVCITPIRSKRSSRAHAAASRAHPQAAWPRRRHPTAPTARSASDQPSHGGTPRRTGQPWHPHVRRVPVGWPTAVLRSRPGLDPQLIDRP